MKLEELLNKSLEKAVCHNSKGFRKQIELNREKMYYCMYSKQCDYKTFDNRCIFYDKLGENILELYNTTS